MVANGPPAGRTAERRRVQSNNEVLTDSVEFYRTRAENTPHPAKCSNSGRRRWNGYNAQLTAQVRELRIKVPAAGGGGHDGHADRSADHGAPGTRRSAADSVGEIWCRGAKGCRFGKGRPRSGILRTAESPRSEDFQMGGSACERRRHNPDRFGELPRYKHRHPPANRTPGSAAIPIYPLGHESNPAGGRVVEPAHTDRLY